VSRPTHIDLRSSSLPRAGAAFNVLGIVAVHVGTVVAFARGASPRLVALAAFTYLVRVLAVTLGYHRYFAHRAFSTGRGTQLFLALLGTTATQKGPLWWAATHRARHAPQARSAGARSSLLGALLRSHAGFCLSRAHEPTRFELVPDLVGYPELRLVDRWSLVGPLAMVALLLACGGVNAVLWGYVVSTCFLMHTTFTLDSLAHDADGGPTRRVLRALERLGVVSSVRPLSARVHDGGDHDADAGTPAAAR
jgi:stearoyl-CoA desaturase (delta-9 desaturase)